MELTASERASLRDQIARAEDKLRVRRLEVLRSTVRSPRLASPHQWEAEGPSPWETRSAPGQDYDQAVRRDGVVT